MKILTWNCAGAFRKKFMLLAKFDADIVVVQECEDPGRTKDNNYRKWASNYLWIGDNKNKGLGIFARDNVKLEKLDWDSGGLKYFIPCKINNDFNIVGAWCHGANSPTFGYIGQLWKYLQLHKSKLGKSVIVGDLNSNVIWDKWDRWWNHSDVVRELCELKIESLYHKYFSEEQGKEIQPTFYLHRNQHKPYHIDYVFGSAEVAASLALFAVGKSEPWLETSDHMPVFCQLIVDG